MTGISGSPSEAGRAGRGGWLNRRKARWALRRRAGLLPVWKRGLGSDGLSTAALAYVTSIEDDLRRLAPAICGDPDADER